MRKLVDLTRSLGADLAAAPDRLRLAFIGMVFLGCVAGLSYRLFGYQIVNAAHYRGLAEGERHADLQLLPRRGALLDSGGNPLATTVYYQQVSVVGSQLANLDVVAGQLAPILGMPTDDLRSRIDVRSQRKEVIKDHLSTAVADQVDALALNGVYRAPEAVREYPEGSLAAQILGFVSVDQQALSGLELSYDKELAGKPGTIDTETDTGNSEILLGRRVITQPIEGADLVLTLDRFVQRTAQQLLDDAVTQTKSSGGLIIVMEPSSGNILAVANNPTYSLTADQIFDPARSQLYKSTIVTNQYEPGSTMKSLSMAAAIDAGVVSPGTVYDDVGAANIQGTIIHNWDGGANGRINMTRLLIRSSNVGMQWVAGLLGPDRFYHYVTDVWGFGSPTGIRLPGEVGGTVRTNKDANWSRVDLATNSYGQGIAVTPLQLLVAFSSLANDGAMMQPRLVRAVRTAAGTQVLEPVEVRRTVSHETAQTMLQMLTTVGGQDAYNTSKVPGFPFALKTGTADTATNLGYNTAVTVGSAISMFPANKPRFSVLVRLDGPEALYGGVVAVPVLGNLVRAMVTYYRIPPTSIAQAAR